MKKCTDCYEVNADTRTRCVRCGRLLDPVSYGSKNSNDPESEGKFEVQHEDAPNVMRTDRSVYRR